MQSSDIVIVSAKRSPIGNFNGTLAALPAHKISEEVIKDMLATSKVPASDISELIAGQILSAAAGQNPARQASVNAGIPVESPAWGLNQLCGSGLKAIALGADSIRSGASKVVLAGGQESMSQAPHAANFRNGFKMGPATMVDTMVVDGLWDVFGNVHMGITAENIAEKFNISRDDQDKFAVGSQNKAEAAQKSGRFKDEITPVKVMIKREEALFSNDEFIRIGAKLEDMQKLKAAFKKDGTVTAGNASGINDGSAFVMLMTRAEAEKRGLPVLATIRSFAQAGVDPSIMGTGPIPASRKALEIAGWDIKQLDLIEANEAFAAQAVCVDRQLGWDVNKVNVNGGAIALGHPIGASGGRVLVTLIHEMIKRDAKKGIATLCVGGGMGVAMCVER